MDKSESILKFEIDGATIRLGANLHQRSVAFDYGRDCKDKLESAISLLDEAQAALSGGPLKDEVQDFLNRHGSQK